MLRLVSMLQQRQHLRLLLQHRCHLITQRLSREPSPFNHKLLHNLKHNKRLPFKPHKLQNGAIIATFHFSV